VSRALSSELLKLRTTRTFYALVGSAMGLVLLIVGIAAAAATFSSTDLNPGRDLLTIASLTSLFGIVLGILAVGSEFRHGTITPTLLVIPDRRRLMVAKLIVHFFAGLLFGLLTFLLAWGVMAAIFSARGIDTGLGGGGDARAMLIGMALATALYAAFGVGIGAVVRNQVGAIVGTLAYIFVVETLIQVIPGVDTTVEKYGIGGVTSAVSRTNFDSGNTLHQLPATLLLALYAAIFLIVGTVLLQRRDVTA
jgi:ABC-2 type transport system permease protein